MEITSIIAQIVAYSRIESIVADRKLYEQEIGQGLKKIYSQKSPFLSGESRSLWHEVEDSLLFLLRPTSAAVIVWRKAELFYQKDSDSYQSQ